MTGNPDHLDPLLAARDILGDPAAAGIIDRRLRAALTTETLPPVTPAAVTVILPPPARRHRENAEIAIDEAENNSGTHDPLTLATIAVAEATLALAAQQRIANLIALQATSRESHMVTIRRELEP